MTSRSLICFAAVLLAASDQPNQRARLAFEHRISHLNGSQLQVKVVEVTYGPGESSEPHTHPCPIVGYIIEGAVRMQMGATAKEVVYKAGEGFYEEANTKHMIGANASQTERARFLATFLCDRAVSPLSTPLHGHAN